MPIYAYYNDTGPLWIDIDDAGWITSATSTATTATSSWYPFGGATSIPTASSVTQGYYSTPSGLLYHDAQWIAFQNRAATFNANQAAQREVGIIPPASPAIIRERVEAEHNRQVAEARERHARQQAEQERIKLAKGRALALLLEHLTPEQRRMFESNGWFIVEGGKSKKKYKIHTNQVAGNIDVLKEDSKVIERICCHCDYSIPYHDQHLAQKLMLEHAEDDFLRIANIRRFA